MDEFTKWLESEEGLAVYEAMKTWLPNNLSHNALKYALQMAFHAGMNIPN